MTPEFNTNWFEFLILALTTWRITSLLVSEKGPADVFVKFREWAGVKWHTNAKGQRTTRYGTNWVASGLTCAWCTSVWVGFGLLPAYLIFPNLTLWFGLSCAWSAIAVLIKTNLT